MAAEIKKATGVEPELIRDGGGVFDVVVDDERTVFSKHQQNRFPEHQEVLDALVAG